MGKCGSLPVSLGLGIFTSITGLLLGPGLPVCNSGYST